MARVVVDVMLKPEILDPQGQAVANALPRLGVSDVASVRIGKRIEGAPHETLVVVGGGIDQVSDRLLGRPSARQPGLSSVRISDAAQRILRRLDGAPQFVSQCTHGRQAGYSPAM